MAIKFANVLARDEMDISAFGAMMQRGLGDAKADRSRHAAEVFAEWKRELQ